MPISKSSRHSHTKYKSHWGLMDSMEKFTAILIVATLGFFIHLIFFI